MSCLHFSRCESNSHVVTADQFEVELVERSTSLDEFALGSQLEEIVA